MFYEFLMPELGMTISHAEVSLDNTNGQQILPTMRYKHLFFRTFY